MTDTPIRRRFSGQSGVSGKDWSTQGRDLDAFLGTLVPTARLYYSGYAAYPIALAVEKEPYAILCVRIQPQTNTQSTFPQGGFTSFAYDARNGVANVTSINALDSLTGAPLSATTLYNLSFLAVF